MVKVKGINKNLLGSKNGKTVSEKDKSKKRKQIVEPLKSPNINGTVDIQKKTTSKLTKPSKVECIISKKSKNSSEIEQVVWLEKSPEISKKDRSIKKQRKTGLNLVSKKKLLKEQNQITDSTVDEVKTEEVKKNLKTKTKKVNVQSEKDSKSLKHLEFEKKFNIKVADVENALKGVITIASNNPKLKNELFDEERPVFLQINAFKIPHIKNEVKTVFRIPLTNSILPTNADICLIVPDVKGIKNIEHEQHVEHYENLLNKKGVMGIKKIMTFHEFRTEYDTFELKNRLVDLYDFFMVDGRIGGKVVHKCGKIFYEKRKLPISVKLQATKLKSHIDSTLKKVFFQQSFKGDSHIVQFGHTKMPIDALVENMYSVVEFLSKHFPGKIENIRSLNINVYRGASIPIYLSMKNPNDVNVPTLKSLTNKNITSVSGELTTQYNAQVTVKPNGVVIVKRTNKKLEENSQNIENDSLNVNYTSESNSEVTKSKRKVVEEQTTSVPSKKKKKIVKNTDETQVEQPLDSKVVAKKEKSKRVNSFEKENTNKKKNKTKKPLVK